MSALILDTWAVLVSYSVTHNRHCP